LQGDDLTFNRSTYAVGGTVQAANGMYVARAADDELMRLCRAGKYAYVLSTRQVGKSSLMIETSRRLAKESVCCAIVDLSRIGGGATPEQWYLSVLDGICDRLSLDIDLSTWWKNHDALAITERLICFFREVVLAQTEEPIIIFLDEIDTTLRLPFSDDFYAAIRALYNARPYCSILERLSFVLIGVAHPSDLIQNPEKTPFNIASRVELTDFTFEEARPLAQGLDRTPKEGERALRQILVWTGGHPYLTLKLCQAVAEEHAKGDGGDTVKHVVNRTFLGQPNKDPNLQFVRDMLTIRAPEQHRAGVLSAYRNIRNGFPVRDEEHPIQDHLRLSGVVRHERGRLRLRNRLYGAVFDKKWIAEHLPLDYRRMLQRAALFLGGAILFASAVVAPTALARLKSAEKMLHKSELKKIEANNAFHKSEQEKKEAVQRSERADKAQKQAETDKRAAQEERKFTAGQLRAAQLKLGEADARLAQARRNLNEANSKRTITENALTLAEKRRQEAVLQLVKRYEYEGRQLWLSGDARGAYVYLAEAYLKAPKDRDNADLRFLLKQVGQAFRGQIASLHGHSDTVNYAQFTTDGKLLATTSLSNAVRLWNPSTGELKEIILLKGSGIRLTRGVLSPDGKRVVITYYEQTNDADGMTLEGKAVLWDVAARKAINDYDSLAEPSDLDEIGTGITAVFNPDSKSFVLSGEQHAGNVYAASTGDMLYALQGAQQLDIARFSPKGEWIVGGEGNVWNAKTGKLLGSLGEKLQMDDATFSIDSQRVFARAGNRVLVWSLAARKLLSSVTLEGEKSTTALFSPTGSLLVTENAAGIAEVRDTTTGLHVATLQGYKGGLQSGGFAPDGIHLAAPDKHGDIQVWNLRTGVQLASLHAHHEGANFAAFSPDGTRIVTTGEDKRTIVWDWNVLRATRGMCMIGKAKGARFAQEGRSIVAVDERGAWEVWNPYTGVRLQTFDTHGSPIKAISPDGNRLLTTDGHLWDALDGTLIKSLRPQGLDREQVAFSANGNYLVSIHLQIGGDPTNSTGFQVWSARKGDPLPRLQGAVDGIAKQVFAVSPNGKWVFAAVPDRDWMWVSSDLNLLDLTYLGAYARDIQAAAFSPDSSLIVTVDKSRTAIVWDVERGRRVATLTNAPKEVVGACFCPDGRRLGIVSKDGTTETWVLKEGKAVTCDGAGSGDSSMFSPDGQRLITVSRDGTARVWSTTTGELLTIIHASSVISSAVFSPKDDQIITTSQDGAVQVWDASLDIASPQAIAETVRRLDPLRLSSDGRLIPATRSLTASRSPAGSRRSK